MCNQKILPPQMIFLFSLFHMITRDKITQSFLQNKKKYSFVILLYF